jgi:HPr kinase/phosphorylase
MYKVTLKEIIDEFKLECVFGAEKLNEVNIITSDINRPGLQLTGFMDYFSNDRIQILGKAEMAYLTKLSRKEREKKIDDFFYQKFPVLVVTRGLEIFAEIINIAKKYDIPVLRTNEITSYFMAALIRYLNLQLALRITKHAGVIEVYGEGILISGEID